MSKPEVFKINDQWFALHDHDGWTDVTPFNSWEAAHEHALWLHWLSTRSEVNA